MKEDHIGKIYFETKKDILFTPQQKLHQGRLLQTLCSIFKTRLGIQENLLDTTRGYNRIMITSSCIQLSLGLFFRIFLNIEQTYYS